MIFFTSDTHWGHQRTCDTTVRTDGSPQEPFKKPDGTPLRPFKSVEEMNEALVERWNDVVSPADHVYHLGDVCMTKRNIDYIGRCNGKKTLVGGNHDTLHVDIYRQFFDDVVGVKELNKHRLVLSHIPIHPDCVDRYGTNVHGHLHANSIPDPRYICVSVEQIDFAPISLEQVLAIVKAQNG